MMCHKPGSHRTEGREKLADPVGGDADHHQMMTKKKNASRAVPLHSRRLR
jgi:hypothetical protein